MNGYIERKNMELNNKKVKELLPQKEPFRFIDYVSDVDKNNKTIQCNYTFKSDNPIFLGHFPQEPIVPGVLLIEAMAQSAILLMLCIGNEIRLDGDKYLLSKVEEVRFNKPLFPDQEAIIVSKIERSIPPFYFFSSKVYNSFDDKILEGKFIVFKK